VAGDPIYIEDQRIAWLKHIETTLVATICCHNLLQMLTMGKDSEDQNIAKNSLTNSTHSSVRAHTSEA
jgi:hypothetical protein